MNKFEAPRRAVSEASYRIRLFFGKASASEVSDHVHMRGKLLDQREKEAKVYRVGRSKRQLE